MSTGAPSSSPVEATLPFEVLAPEPVDATSHYNRSTILCAKAGQTIASVSDPEAARALLGPLVRLSDDGMSLVAEADGRVVVREGRIWVEKSLVIESNVDFATGHIDFADDIVIRGNVADLFKVHGGANVDVEGIIEAAEVIAGGHLNANAGISGKDKAIVRVGGDLCAKYILNATVEAAGRVSARMIANSRVICGGVLDVGSGPVLAGRVVATGGITCGTIGSAAGVRTIVEAGVDEQLRVRSAAVLPELVQQIHKAERIRTTVEPLMRNQKQLTAGQRERATELLFEARTTESEAKKTIESLKQAHEAMTRQAVPEICIDQTLHAGVVIGFPGLATTIDTAIAGPVRVTTKQVRRETRIVLIYGAGSTAHALPTRHLADDGLLMLHRFLTGEKNNPAAAAS